MTTQIDTLRQDPPRRPRAQHSRSTLDATRSGERAAMNRLVRAAKTGDAQAQDELARRLRPMAVHWSLRLLGNPEDAQDVAQDALLRWFASLDRFDGDRSPWPWLRRIVTNSAVDSLRGRRRRETPWSSLGREDGERPLELLDPAVEAGEERVDRRRRARLVRAAVVDLPRHHRQALELREFEGLSYREIAERLDIPIGTVMSRLHAARRRLAELITVRRESARSATARRRATGAAAAPSSAWSPIGAAEAETVPA